MVSALLSFLQENFRSALASSVYYLTIAKYLWENFHIASYSLLAALCFIMDVFYCTQSDLTRFTGNMKYPLPSRKATAIKLGKGVKGKVATYVTSYVCSYTASSSLKSYMGHDWVYTYIIVPQ